MKTAGILIFSAIFTLFFKLVLGQMFFVFLILALWIYSVFFIAALSDIILEQEPTTVEELMQYPEAFLFGPFIIIFFLCSEWDSVVEYFRKKFQHIKIQSPILIKRKK